MNLFPCYKRDHKIKVHQTQCTAPQFTRVNNILNTYTFQCDTICNFHVGEVITSLQKTTLIPGGSESLVYTTLSGAIGMLVPFTSPEVTLFFGAFILKKMKHTVLFVGPLIPLSWYSSFICYGFQSQGGSIPCVLCHLRAMDSCSLY